MSNSHFRREARELGLSWQHVDACYRELKAAAKAEREGANTLRQFCWKLFNIKVPGKWEFWRHGFRSQYGDAADYKVIPGYDTFAQEVACTYPQFEGVDGTERLWEFLLSGHDAMPSKDELYQAALEQLVEMQDVVPF